MNDPSDYVISGEDEWGVVVGEDIEVNCEKEVQLFTKDIWDEGKFIVRDNDWPPLKLNFVWDCIDTILAPDRLKSKTKTLIMFYDMFILYNKIYFMKKLKIIMPQAISNLAPFVDF